MEKTMGERMVQMANRTWETIGNDIFQVMKDEGLSACLSQDEMLEAVSDADYMLTHGGDEEAYKHWNSLPTYKEKLNVLKPAFPCAVQCG